MTKRFKRDGKAAGTGRRSGQAMIETSIVISLLAFILFAVFQISQLYASKEILLHASTAGARARSVGFNYFMVYKVAKAASIPNAGRITHPPDVDTSSTRMSTWLQMTPGQAFDTALRAYPRSVQSPVEQSLIPLYLGTVHWGEQAGILDYADWETVSWPLVNDIAGDVLSVRVSQDLPLRFPFHRTFIDSDSTRIGGRTIMDNHYPVYLE